MNFHSRRTHTLRNHYSLDLDSLCSCSAVKKTSCEHWSKTLFLFLSPFTLSCNLHRILQNRRFDDDSRQSQQIFLFFRFRSRWKVGPNKHRTPHSQICALMQIINITVVISSVFTITNSALNEILLLKTKDLGHDSFSAPVIHNLSVCNCQWLQIT